MNTTTANLYEDRARTHKAMSLFAQLKREKGSYLLHSAARALTDAEWVALAERANTHPASDDTKAMVLSMTHREQAGAAAKIEEKYGDDERIARIARRYHDDDPFAGL